MTLQHLQHLQHLQTTARYSEAVIFKDTVYLAGQLADDLSNDLNGGITSQTRQTFANIERLLQEAGSDKSAILTATIYLRDMARDYTIFNGLWDDWLKDCKAPPRTCIQAEMYQPQVLVEITLTAARIAHD